MQIVVEVVVTNMETGHVAVSQETVKLDLNKVPPANRSEYQDELIKLMQTYTKPTKVGPILIARNFIGFKEK